MTPLRRFLCTGVVALVVVITGIPALVWADDPSVSEMQRELREMKRQMQQMQEKMQHQEKLLEKLGGKTTPTPPSTQTTSAQAENAAPPSNPSPVARPWSPEQPIRPFSSGQSYVNLSFDALADFGWSTTPDVTDLQLGDHDPIQRGFTIPNTEIVLDGAIDPYFTGAADIVFKLDKDNETEIELEEAYLTSTSLPWNLQVKGGQFLTEFGRQNQQHPHAWDFVDLPLVLGRMFGPEGLRNPGARVSWLTPTPFYSEALLSVLDSQGGTVFSFRDGEHEHFGRPPVETKVHNPGDLLIVPRYVASFDLTSSQTLVAGVSGAFGPNATGTNTDTQIYGFDVFWKWKPEWQSGGWPFVSFQTEGLYRRYEAGSASVPGDGEEAPALFLPRESLHDYGFYAQALYGFTHRWVAGLRGEYVTGDGGALERDPDRADRFRLSPNLTFYPTEFSKFRLQWNYDHGQLRGDDHSVWFQTEFMLGSHAAHKF